MTTGNRTGDAKRARIYELAIILAIFVLVNVASQLLQKRVSFHDGQGWDGVNYIQAAKQMSKGLRPDGEAPFVYRIGEPLLVAFLFRHHLLMGFEALDIVGNLVAALLLTIWLRQFLSSWRIRTFLVVLFMTQWHGPTRFVYYNPVYIEPWLFVFLLLGLIGIQQARDGLRPTTLSMLVLVSFVGVLTREVVLIIPLALLFVTNPIPPLQECLRVSTDLRLLQSIKRCRFVLCIPFLFGLLGFVLAHAIARQTNEYSFLKAAIGWAYDKPALTYIHAHFIAFGPLIIAPVYYIKGIRRFLFANQSLLVYLLGLMFLAWIGGSDTERILFWSAPVVYLLIGKVLQNDTTIVKAPALLLFLVGSQLVSQRIFWVIPDYPNSFSTPRPLLTLLTSRLQYLDLYSYHGNPRIEMLSLCQYLLLSVLVLYWWWRCAFLRRQLSTEKQRTNIEEASPAIS